MNIAATDLAIDFPPSRGYNGACSTIADLGHYFSHGMAYPSKAVAVRRVMDAEQWRQMSDGMGNRFARRFARIHQGAFSFIMQQLYPRLRIAEERRQAEQEMAFEDAQDALWSELQAGPFDTETDEPDIGDIECRGESRPHFSHHTNPHEP